MDALDLDVPTRQILGQTLLFQLFVALDRDRGLPLFRTKLVPANGGPFCPRGVLLRHGVSAHLCGVASVIPIRRATLYPTCFAKNSWPSDTVSTRTSVTREPIRPTLPANLHCSAQPRWRSWTATASCELGPPEVPKTPSPTSAEMHLPLAKKHRLHRATSICGPAYAN